MDNGLRGFAVWIFCPVLFIPFFLPLLDLSSLLGGPFMMPGLSPARPFPFFLSKLSSPSELPSKVLDLVPITSLPVRSYFWCSNPP